MYLSQIVTYGYEDAPLEIDARAHEIQSAISFFFAFGAKSWEVLFSETGPAQQFSTF
jgi:hypothetical protein